MYWADYRKGAERPFVSQILSLRATRKTSKSTMTGIYMQTPNRKLLIKLKIIIRILKNRNGPIFASMVLMGQLPKKEVYHVGRN
ncbi:MAG: hypothetical protein DRP02_13430 [Candidatus Gerdarchaeota archaeon]|nr:MAG: hypothetical protein DRP02_13430 [Candidatus Gerdarchaeota archaeon]